MSSCKKQSSMLPRLLAAAFATIGALLSLTDARAEIILDGFDEAFEIVLPEMEGDFITQFSVGALEAERRSQVSASSGSEPTGRADANLTQPSVLNFALNRLNPHPVGGLPVVALSLSYYFEEVDITQGGINDRVSIDFASVASARPLARIDVFVQDASQPGISYVSQLFDIPSQDEPFSLQFPLDSFSVRGGGGGRIDFQRVYWTLVTTYPVYFSGPNEINFSTAVDSIRFTSTVPEPRSGLAFLAVTWAILFCFRGRRMERCGAGSLPHFCQVFFLPSKL